MASSSDNDSMWFKGFSLLFTLANLAVTSYVTIRSNDIDNKLKDLESIKKTVEINQAQLSFDRDFKLKIYDLCIQAIKEKDLKQQQTALVAVRGLVTDNDDFKQGLVSILSDSKDPDIKQAAKEAEFVLSQDKEIPKQIVTEGKIYVDIFYYQGVEGTKELAQKLYNALKFSNSYEVGVGVKVLTVERNENASYKLGSTQIRYDANEKTKAGVLQKTASELLSSYGLNVDTVAARPGKESPGYLSFFIMNSPKQ